MQTLSLTLGHGIRICIPKYTLRFKKPRLQGAFSDTPGSYQLVAFFKDGQTP